jgi:hypothetical protein
VLLAQVPILGNRARRLASQSVRQPVLDHVPHPEPGIGDTKIAISDQPAKLCLGLRLGACGPLPYDPLAIALPLLRPLRLLRLVSLLRVLNRRAATGLRGRLVVYVSGGAALLAFCGALAVLDAERTNPEANITNFSDAVWWAITTMTTVGYGDRYPTTGIGRLAAAALMLVGSQCSA